ncbi:amidohydrolase [Bacillus piscicola]|uniref:amidohydrolase n=1 Tax=Bacillus piscicola TaxID=1632684 RepID=UPI001F0931E6|nr:amidohydrolase [Bacillus piscicola]
MKKTTLELIEKLVPSLVEWRRDFHKHPEPGWAEFRTASIVASRLESWGYQLSLGREVVEGEKRMGVPGDEMLQRYQSAAMSEGDSQKWMSYFEGGYTGVVGTLDTGIPGPTICFRFDMDALEIQESLSEEHLPVQKNFVSQIPSVMHACGHDAHTAIGLGTACILSEIKDKLKGRIKLVFQPAEEGARGAHSMVSAGVVDDADFFIASHVGLGAALGEIVCADLGFLATTKLDVSYHGKAAHAGAEPHNGNNALLAAATASLNLHAISRHSEGTSRINVGELIAGSGRNIIPDSAHLKVETRGETTTINNYMYERALRVIEAAADMYDVKSSITIAGSSESGEPSEKLLDFISETASEVSAIHTITRNFTSGGSEDATHMMRRVQENGGEAAYIVFGTSLAAGHHNEWFDIDEEVLASAVETYVLCAYGLGQSR